ncbi:MAG: phosphoglycerate dehydrogenase [Propionibacteriaceae bacterium]
MTRPAILVTPRSLTRAGLDRIRELAPLTEAGFRLVSCTPGVAPGAEELQRLLPGCVGWLAGVEPISAETLAAAGDLQVISRNGVGVDSVDLAAAERHGVRVEVARNANSQGVAELAIAQSLAALRHTAESTAALRDGRWERSLGRELASSVVGIVGLGAIGRRVAQLAAAFGARVLGHDPYVDRVEGVEVLPFAELLGQVDVLTLHSPAGERPLVDAAALELIKPGAVLVNTARAALVDEAATLAALENGRLAAYAVDAFAVEPPPPSELLAHPRTIATPHLGGYTAESTARATSYAVTNLLDTL